MNELFFGAHGVDAGVLSSLFLHFGMLSLLSLTLLAFLNTATRALAVAGFAIAVLYPFMKRWTHLPQVVLGAGVLMTRAMRWCYGILS